MYFCYLLKSSHEKHLNDTYIGFTDDPIRRLRQHNGLIKGGGKKTSKKRPWSLVLVISNFPNKIVALKFEWAWTNPFQSTFTSEKLKNFEVPQGVKNKKKYYEGINFKLSVLNILLNSKVFDKISLYLHSFDEASVPHMEIKNLHILELTDEKNFKESVKNKIYFYEESNTSEQITDNIIDKCIICEESFSPVLVSKPEGKGMTSEEEEIEIESGQVVQASENYAKCPFCQSLFHITCLADRTIGDELALIPKETNCIVCTRSYNWSEFIKFN